MQSPFISFQDRGAESGDENLSVSSGGTGDPLVHCGVVAGLDVSQGIPRDAPTGRVVQVAGPEEVYSSGIGHPVVVRVAVLTMEDAGFVLPALLVEVRSRVRLTVEIQPPRGARFIHQDPPPARDAPGVQLPGRGALSVLRGQDDRWGVVIEVGEPQPDLGELPEGGKKIELGEKHELVITRKLVLPHGVERAGVR
jgi:hypothetical protein